MRLNYRYAFYIFVFLFAIYNVLTLTYSPLPWFDEVFFSSISETYAKHGVYKFMSRSIVTPFDGRIYGPVYFFIQAKIINIFGLHLFTNRLLNLISGIANLFLLRHICKQFLFKDATVFYCVVFFCLDPITSQELHSGRMECLMLFFIFTSYILLLKIYKGGNFEKIITPLSVGVFFALAVLTSPRSFYFAMVYPCTVIYDLIYRKIAIAEVFKRYCLIGLSFAGVYFLWISYGFGGINSYLNYINSFSDVIKEHTVVDSSFNYHYVFFVYCLALFVLYLFANKRFDVTTLRVISFVVPTIITFFFIVKLMSATYLYLIVPFVAVGIYYVQQKLSNRLLTVTNALILISFLVSYTYKNLLILANLEQRDPEYFASRIYKYVEPNSLVAGDYQYYYIARAHGCPFQCIAGNGSVEQQFEYHRINKTRYYIVGKTTGHLSEFYTWLNKDYRLIGEVRSKKNSELVRSIAANLRVPIASAYDCLIYERRN